LLELRRALQALRGPLGNVPAFRKTIQAILENDDTRAQVMTELGMTE
jgi:type VI secretion system protein ImpB